MAWIKLNDNVPSHPKIVGLSDAAFRAYVGAICYCSHHLTDGFVPTAAFRLMATKRAETELFNARLIYRIHGGIEIHDYLEHQSSRADVEDFRERQSRNGKKGGRPRKPNPNPVGYETENPNPNPLVNPKPNPNVTQKKPEDRRQKTEDRTKEKTGCSPPSAATREAVGSRPDLQIIHG